MTGDINGDVWSAMCKLETSSVLKYGKEIFQRKQLLGWNVPSVYFEWELVD